MITDENLMLHELIGLDAEIVQSSNEQIVGMKGRIVDETKSLLILNLKNENKKLPKENTIWRFSLRQREIELNGNLILKRPFERLGIKI